MVVFPLNMVIFRYLNVHPSMSSARHAQSGATSRAAHLAVEHHRGPKNAGENITSWWFIMVNSG